MRVRRLLSARRWFLEIVSPRTRLSRKVLEEIHRIRSRLTVSSRGTLPIYVWDLRANAITFDILFELLQIYLENEKDLKDGLDVVLYLPEQTRPVSFKKIGEKSVFTEKDLFERIEKLIVPLVGGFNFVRSVSTESSVEKLYEKLAAATFTIPKYYHPIYYYPPVEPFVSLFDKLKTVKRMEIPYVTVKTKANDGEHSIPRNLSSPYATFTIRDYGWSPERNTNYQDVQEFIKFVKGMGMSPVIIPDDLSRIEHYDLPSDCIVDFSARKEIAKRYNTYSKSVFNVFTISGPSTLSMLIRGSRTVIYNFGVPSLDADPRYLKKNLGLNVFEQPFLRLGGIVIWWQMFPRLTAESLEWAISHFHGAHGA